jgi:hypothetical protein
MALTWELSKIKDYKNVCWIDDKETGERRMNPVTEVLIWGTMSIGIGQFTDKNIDEVAARFRVMERIHGAFLYKPAEGGGKNDWYLSDEDFIKHIGLWCNVSDETRVRWAGRIFSNKQTSVTEEIRTQFVRDRNRKKETVEA